MPHGDVIALAEFARGEHVMTVCNACRYCEQYCPVFPAMEERTVFGKADLTYLANLCHNCGECLYACQFAPPHEFGINVPQTLARIRLRSYEEQCWPRPLGAAFRQHGVSTALGMMAALSVVMFASVGAFNPSGLRATSGEFYAVVPHGVMVSLFGGVGLFVLMALAIGLRRFNAAIHADATSSAQPLGSRERPSGSDVWRGLRDALTLRHLHSTGVDCTSSEEARYPWRRWFHHATLYGFALCFASTSVAALYHVVFGWHAPHAYTSLPVVLGTLGGVGLLVGPAGLAVVRRSRDQELGDAAQKGMDESFILLLWLTSLTGLALLVLREHSAMSALLIIHLGAVLTLFITLPYGKFVHGIYRTAALVKYAAEMHPKSPEPRA
jgi:citrate/tricarballylate utilization protein